MKKKPRSVPSWDDYFMALCLMAASRSKDPATQHGAVIVDDDHRIMSTGYNGVPKKIVDTDISWSRPEKYPFIVHAEENAIDYCMVKPSGMTMYISGPPCFRCTRRIINNKMFKVIYGPQTSSMVDEEDWKHTKELARLSHLTMESYSGNLNWLRDRLSWMEEHWPEVFQPRPAALL